MTLEVSGIPLLPALAAAIPAVFATAALATSRARPLRSAGLAAAAALVLAVAVAVGVATTTTGVVPDASPIAAALARAVRVDLVTGVMSVLICVLALVIVPYSRRYLDGDPGLPRHARALLGVLTAVMTLVVSNNLAVIALAWVATSFALHQLLTFHRDRQQAVITAHKKFLLSRIADVFLAGALLLLGLAAGSLDLDRIEAWVGAQQVLPVTAHAAAVLLVFAVALKSAQLPFHGWLIQVMEAPTPVSALLHAGVVNIGGFVLIRLAPLMSQAFVAQGLLVAIGMTTMIGASLVATTRVSIKVSLAWSTCAQMGFMLVQCGLGAWHLALLHLVAHSLYKAHAFSSAGTTVDRWEAHHMVPTPGHASPGLFAAAAIAVTAAFGTAVVLAQHALAGPQDDTLMPFMVLLGLSLAPVVASGAAAGWRPLTKVALRTAGLAGLYLAWHLVFAGVLPHAGNAGLGPWAFVIAGFTVLVAMQVVMQIRPRGSLARALRPWLFAGFYLDEVVTRRLFRAWPPPTPASSPTRAEAVRMPEILEVRP